MACGPRWAAPPGCSPVLGGGPLLVSSHLLNPTHMSGGWGLHCPDFTVERACEGSDRDGEGCFQDKGVPEGWGREAPRWDGSFTPIFPSASRGDWDQSG